MEQWRDQWSTAVVNHQLVEDTEILPKNNGCDKTTFALVKVTAQQTDYTRANTS